MSLSRYGRAERDGARAGLRGCALRFWERGLPALGVAVGIVLVAGPFLATLIRSLLYWAPDGGVSFSLRNFTSLIGDARFQDAALNTLICGAGTTVVSCTLGVTLAWIVSRTGISRAAAGSKF